MTESFSALSRVHAVGPRLQAQERRNRLQVVLDPVVDLLGEHAAQHRPPVLERDRRVARDRAEQRAVLAGERRVAVADELADLPPLPAQRNPHRVLARLALRPHDLAVLEHQRRPRGVERVDRRLDDSLERLLQVERLRDRLGDAREGLQLADPPLRLGVELGVLDRLRHLRGDRDEEVDLGRRELARLSRPDVQRALELVPGEDRHREDRLVLVLRQVRERLEPLVEVRLGRDHHRLASSCGRTRDPLARAHPRPAGHLLDPRPVRRPQYELGRLLVVEVDEARVGAEGVRDLARDEREHLFEVEARVDGGDRLRQEAQVTGSLVHLTDCRSGRDLKVAPWICTNGCSSSMSRERSS